MADSDSSEPSVRWNAVCLDCHDVGEMARFYGGFLGFEIRADEGDWIAMADPGGGVGLNLQADESYARPTWPEQPGLPGKMMHFEIEVDDVPAAVGSAVACGAIEAQHQPADRDPELLRIMLDPAGHPFCLWSD
jgi:catechol 2,3-dioxygenase-like lactoylglutathione lyase family enzyme